MLHTILTVIRRTFSTLEKIFAYLAMGIFIAMVLIFCYTIVMRYAFNLAPLQGRNFIVRFLNLLSLRGESVVIHLISYLGILSLPLGMRLYLQRGGTAIYDNVPQRMQKAVFCFVCLLIIGFGVVFMFAGITFFAFIMKSPALAADLPASMKPVVLVKYLVIPFSGLFVIYHALEQLFIPRHKFLEQSGNHQ
jgi:TRAP-type C4-dicarboxylate transport system permease small subunit